MSDKMILQRLVDAASPDALADIQYVAEHEELIPPLLKAIEALAPKIAPQSLLVKASELMGIESNVVGRIANALVNLVAWRSNMQLGEQQARTLFTALLEQARKRNSVDLPSGGTTFTSALATVRDDHPLVIAVKARRLGGTYENIVGHCEIITDMRPVFTKEGSSIADILIRHQLVIQGYDDSQVFFTLVDADLSELSRACERALLKAKTTRDTLQKTLRIPSNAE